jgi:hypothetical protein
MSGAEQTKARSRGVSRDMSPQAISGRFDILVELDQVARLLRAAGRRLEQSPNKRKKQ